MKILKTIKPLDKKFLEKSQKYHRTLLMPEDALKNLLELVEKLSGIYQEFPVRKVQKRQAIIFAADHGVAIEGVSAYPQEVTQQMLGSFANGWAVITVLAKNQNMEVTVVDVGVKGEPVKSPKIINKKIGQGTKNFLKEPAMSKEEALKSIEIGIEMAKKLANEGCDIAILGEMGIGSTTSSSAIAAAILGEPAESVTGRGTGVDNEKYQNKIAIVSQALKLHRPNPADALDVLQKVGGYEIGAMCGLILGCAAYRIPVVLDGFITGAAALLAYKFSPDSINYCFAGHQSEEIGHQKILKYLNLRPILDFNLRLGEGSGAALALPIIEQAINISRETATFQTAGVSDKD